MSAMLTYMMAFLFVTETPSHPNGFTAYHSDRYAIQTGGNLGWGWDDNVFWSLMEDQGHILPPGLTNDQLPPIVSDHFFLVSPFLSSRFSPAPRHTFNFKWTGEHRQYLREKWQQIHNVNLGYDLRMFRKLFGEIQLQGTVNTRGKHREERYWSGKTKLSVSWRHHPVFSVWGGYFFRAVYFPDPSREADNETKLNYENGLEIGLRWKPAEWLQMEAHYNYVIVTSNKEFHDHDSHRLFFNALLPMPWRLRLLLSVGGATNHFSRFHVPGIGTPDERKDLVAWIETTLQWEPLRWLSVWASHSLEYVHIDFAQEKGKQHRMQFLAGVGLKWGRTWRYKRKNDFVLHPSGWQPEKQKETPKSTKSERGPAQTQSVPSCKGQWVTFHYNEPRAEKVSVIGDFNGWNKEQGIMIKKAGRWTFTICLSPGRHLYTYRVNDRVVKSPPDAETTVPDGFGNFNGVLFVLDESD